MGSPELLLHLLCSKITGLKGDALTPYYKLALTTLGSSIYSPTETDEFQVVEKIKRKLVRENRVTDASHFSELYAALQRESLLKKRWSILYLLHRLSGEVDDKPKSGSSGLFYRGLSTHLMSTPSFAAGHHNVPPGGSTLQTQHSARSTPGSSAAGSSGISSIRGSFMSQDSSPTPQSVHPSYLKTPAGAQLLKSNKVLPSTGDRVLQIMGKNQTDTTLRSERMPSTVTSYRSQAKPDISEMTLLRELIYVFRGIEGKYIKYDVTKEGYRIDPKTGISRSVRRFIARLSECGWMYNQIWKYAHSRSTDRAFGLVGQSFCAALHQELTEYYRLMAVLESQLQQISDEAIEDCDLSLFRLNVWMYGPHIRLKTMAALVDVCQGKKGGALASVVHSYLQHGDPVIRSLIRHMLTLVAQPIFSTIISWQYHGELEDTYHEFFVASDPTVKNDRLWHEKYTLRKSMIPSFISMEQAKKILLTGKSVNFLRQVCHDRTSIRSRQVIRQAETNQVESIFSQEVDGLFQNMIDTVYKETSHHLLDILNTKYKFFDHLKAMRRYLLLGQGDFIRYLMDLLQDDLSKPPQMLFLHNLTSILETAIRGTNAQYDDSDILKRLDVRLLEVSPGDVGWDVFSLDYRVDGPVRTVFTSDSMIMYLRVFNFLWRAKRMEYILSSLWKSQMSNVRMLKSVPELSPVLHQCHILASEMVHFVQQVQYYINFEVLECSWDELVNKVKAAEDLDYIISAHQVFLSTISTRCLLDKQSQPILTQLRTIFDLIIQFQTKQDAIYQSIMEELAAREHFEHEKQLKQQQGTWSIVNQADRQEEKRRKQFSQSMLSVTKAQLSVLANSYQNMVQQFLLMLAQHSDVSLRFLSFRLDFNEQYHATERKHRSTKSSRKSSHHSHDDKESK